MKELTTAHHAPVDDDVQADEYGATRVHVYKALQVKLVLEFLRACCHRNLDVAVLEM